MHHWAETMEARTSEAPGRFFAATVLAIFLMAGSAQAGEPDPFCEADERGCRVTLMSAGELQSTRAGQGTAFGAPGASGWEYAVVLWDELEIGGKGDSSPSQAAAPSQSRNVSINGR